MLATCPPCPQLHSGSSHAYRPPHPLQPCLVISVGVQVGVAIASWINYQSNFIPHDGIELVGSPPYHIKTPDMDWLKMAMLRMVIGYSSLFLARAVS